MTVGKLLPLVLACASACAPEAYRISAMRSLQPVDAARPMVVFNQIQGEACGRDAVLGAIRDLKRLDNVDGFVEVIIETRGEKEDRCAKVTAFPFRYGTSTDSPRVLASYQEPAAHVIVGRDAQASPASAEQRFGDECARVAALLEPDSIQRGLLHERCRQRSKDDGVFARCITSALQAPEAQACLHSGGGSP